MVHKIYTILFFAFSLSATMAQDQQLKLYYAEHFKVNEKEDGVKILTVINPWPNSNISYEFALIPKDNEELKANYRDYQCIFTPVERIVLSSTTHIPSVVDLDEVESIVGFAGTDLISSKEVREAIDIGQIKELGLNEKINIETAIALHPEVIIGFSINSSNKAYDELEAFGIPIVLNADWLEQSPLAKAEWVKFFGLFFNKEAQAQHIFNQIEADYLEAKKLAAKANKQPTLISGSLYKDVWYAQERILGLLAFSKMQMQTIYSQIWDLVAVYHFQLKRLSSKDQQLAFGLHPLNLPHIKKCSILIHITEYLNLLKTRRYLPMHSPRVKLVGCFILNWRHIDQIWS